MFVRFEEKARAAAFCFYDLFKPVCGEFMRFPSSFFFSMRFVRVEDVHLYSSTDIATARKKSRLIFSEGVDFHMIDNLSIVSTCISITLSVYEILLPRYVNWPTDFRG